MSNELFRTIDRQLYALLDQYPAVKRLDKDEQAIVKDATSRLRTEVLEIYGKHATAKATRNVGDYFTLAKEAQKYLTKIAEIELRLASAQFDQSR
jgi:hypothetical protein